MSAEHNAARHAPLSMHSDVRIGNFAIHGFEGRGIRSESVSADGVLVTTLEDGIRAAVMDGVTPLPETPGWMGLDGAVAGMATVRSALLHSDAAEACLRRANHELHRPGVQARAQPQATVLVADITADGEARLLRGCDTEAWVLDGDDGWRCLFPPAPRPWATEAWRRILTLEPELRVDRVARWRRESAIWDDPEAWESHPIGRFAHPSLETIELAAGAWQALVLATDGAGTRERGAGSVQHLAEAIRSMNGEPAEGDQGVLLIEWSQALRSLAGS